MLRSVVQTQVRLMKPVQKAAAARFMATQSNETYSEKQAKKGRPVSPHVTIYKFPVVALSSITNRVTGVILSGGKSYDFLSTFPSFCLNPLQFLLRLD